MHVALWLFSVALSLGMAVRGLKQRSLSRSGAVAAVVVGLCTFSNQLALFTVTLLVFFVSSSKLTKFRSDAKKTLEVEFHEGKFSRAASPDITCRIVAGPIPTLPNPGGQRDAYQVLCNGFTGAAISLAYTVYGSDDPRVPFYDLAPALPKALVLMYIA
ncbi:hypothetical protein H4R34_004804 [Dimargaris verticillata]|uniref:Uncharacterized protein n=1 Tax=Dimargaris verticillata TaxID=2761393 RepID=A0A9W8B4U8_9FUNG|nr:hypothetical protein H4R34_004804 [Dimargaris verticillata]